MLHWWCSSVGFESREIKVVAGTPVTVKLSSSSTSLDDVVVTALGVKRERRSIRVRCEHH